jgi:hypothetical protein
MSRNADPFSLFLDFLEFTVKGKVRQWWPTRRGPWEMSMDLTLSNNLFYYISAELEVTREIGSKRCSPAQMQFDFYSLTQSELILVQQIIVGSKKQNDSPKLAPSLPLGSF